MTANGTGALSAATRKRLENLHRGLLRLHKILLDDERAGYEKAHGRASAGEMLQLVISNAQFAWLRRISELIVQIDEVLESEEPGDPSGLINHILSLLMTPESAGEFGSKYQQALQRLPDAVLAHKEITAILSRAD
jgi:hypothetical protein